MIVGLSRISRIIKKLGINIVILRLLGRILSFIPEKKINLVSWKDYLSNLYPDNGKSAIWQNSINIEEIIDLDVIIPVYNVEKYVGECLESVISQETKYNYRIIIVNDGSTDNSLKEIQKYALYPNVFIINQENKGLSGARNTGLKHVKGKYVTFLDSDDLLNKNCIQLLLDEAYLGSYDIVGGAYVRFDGEREFSASCPQHNEPFGYAWGKVYRTTIFEKICFPEHYWFEDTVSKMLLHDYVKNTSCIKQVVYKHRLNRHSICFRSIGNPKLVDTLWVTLRLLSDRDLIQIPFDDKFADRLINQIRINTIRLLSLNDRKVNYSNFCASVELYTKYYKQASCLIKNNKIIEETILDKNYRLFILSCILLN